MSDLLYCAHTREVREAGARIKLISDGDVAAAIEVIPGCPLLLTVTLYCS